MEPSEGEVQLLSQDHITIITVTQMTLQPVFFLFSACCLPRTIYGESGMILARAAAENRILNSLGETGSDTKALLPTPVELIYSLETRQGEWVHNCQASLLNDKWIRLAFCVFLADFNCSFGWREYNFCSKVDNDSLLLSLLFP